MQDVEKGARKVSKMLKESKKSKKKVVGLGGVPSKKKRPPVKGSAKGSKKATGAKKRGGKQYGEDYERELRRLLTGDISKPPDRAGLSKHDKAAYQLLEEFPFLVVRAGGSFGCDLVALRGDISFPIEVKSSTKKTIHFGGSRLQAQAEEFIHDCSRSKVLPLYAFRHKGVRGEKWRLFMLPVDFGQVRLHVPGNLIMAVPKAERTKAGNFKMEWADGMPLSHFIIETTAHLEPGTVVVRNRNKDVVRLR